MKVLSLFEQRSLPLMRRVLAPFSVLHQRGYTFAFMQSQGFDPTMGASHDVMVLSNWVLTEDEIHTLWRAISDGHQTFVYDLSLPHLLQNESVRRTLLACQLVTVPNEFLAKEVRIVVPQTRVQVLPSVVDIPYFMSANAAYVSSGMSKRPKQETIVGCFGDFDWHLCTQALREAQQKASPDTLYCIGDAGAKAALGDLVQEVEVTLDAYPRLLKSCSFGLMPMERETGRDMIVQHEYGIFSVPTLKARSAKQVQQMLPHWLSSSHHSSHEEQGAELFLAANEWRATKLAQQYRHVYEQKLRMLAKPV